MALTSTMLPLGTPAPPFRLQDTVTGRMFGLTEVRGSRATVVMFICNHCPYVKHVNPELIRLAKEYGDRGVGFVAISSNDAASYPEDAPAKMKETAARLGYPFPYLYDESQDVARAYHAACTPDLYVFDGKLECAYRGRLDGSTPGNGLPVNGAELRAALDDMLAGRKPGPDQKPCIGCGIKWKK